MTVSLLKSIMSFALQSKITNSVYSNLYICSVKHFILILVIVTSSLVHGQVIQKEKYEHYKNKEIPLTGPSSRAYGWWYVGYGFILGPVEGDSAEIILGKSSSFTVGYRGKLRITNWLQVGGQIAYYYHSYHLVQDSSKALPSRQLFDRERMVFNNLNVSPYVRFTFHKKRSNQMGKILDIGGYVGWTYRTRHIGHQKYNTPNSVGGMKTDFSSRGLVYAEPYHYGLNARLGIGHIVVYASYRLSNLFKSSYNFAELPRTTLGIEIGLHE